MALHSPNFQQLFESSPGLYLVLTRDFTIVAVTNAYLQATMTERESILGKNIFEVFPDNPRDPTATGVANLRSSLQRVVQTRAADTMAVQKYDIPRPQSEGGGFEERFWSPRNSPVFGADGDVEYIIHRVEDVTEFIRLKKRRAEQEKDYQELRLHSEQIEAEVFQRAQEIQESNRKLREANEELRAAHKHLSDADRRKDEFLAMLAHELRNPLAPIRSGLDILAMSGSDQADTIAVMQEQMEHLVRLVDDLLDMSRIMQGRIELRRDAVELSALVNRSLETVRPLIETHRHELDVSLPEHPVWLDADPVRILQVIENLLTNAIKYTDTGGRIEVTVEQDGAEAVVSVRDTGVGIEEELLSQVFDLFMQSPRSIDRAQGGLGIGLTLVQKLVTMHGGSITAHSAGRGNGSTFVVRLPVVKPPAPASDTSVPPTSGESRRILVVDDNQSAAKMLSILLTRLGDHEVETIYEATEVVASVQEFRPDLILLDIGLPKMNGYEVARALRREPDFDNIQLVALTGYGQDEDREKSKAAGFDLHLVKPPAIEQIKAVLAHPMQNGE
ncbi:hybrid sensor histidine kinase/response regulator [Rubinisphaera margarita]|uniref:hybrid sensor histidine kinase/response regulator n=1 Tax=Rubinisphaera margarita TaxID=2909586 RepID=UPI001EE91BE4|nr:ATP-binding protein [Rubinisphaera margarita]MCG6156633.1 ATP-binding protein [Rubinisphaera margarita]